MNTEIPLKMSHEYRLQMFIKSMSQYFVTVIPEKNLSESKSKKGHVA